MRIWNGLNINDKVIYKGNIYIVSKLYEENEKRLCNLLSTEKNNDLKGIIVYECIKCK